MPASLESNSLDNLRIGKGILSFKRTGENEFRDLGEVPEAELALTIDKLDYFSSRSGVRSKVKSVTLEQSGTLRFIMNSISPANMALFFLGGDITENNISQPTFDIMDEEEITGEIMFHGTNQVGPRYDVHLHSVQISPTGSINLIDADTWSGVEVTAEILRSSSTQKFGTVTLTNLDSDT